MKTHISIDYIPYYEKQGYGKSVEDLMSIYKGEKKRRENLRDDSDVTILCIDTPWETSGNKFGSKRDVFVVIHLPERLPEGKSGNRGKFTLYRYIDEYYEGASTPIHRHFDHATLIHQERIKDGSVKFFKIPEGCIDPPPNNGLSSMKLIDLFAGTGAFSTAFNQYGTQCVFANDFCTNSESIYNMNHPNLLLKYGDLTKIDNETIPPHNIMCGGFPCQPFSIAGKQEGFGDERSNVFWKILKILDYRKPEIVILENVKNLTSHDNKRTFQVIYENLRGLDYHIHYSILNTANITGLPQNRERIYIVCFKDKSLYDKFSLEFDTKPVKPLKDCLETNVDEKYYYTDRYKVYDAVKEGVIGTIEDNKIYQYRRYYVRENKSNLCPTLTANMGGGGHNVPLLKDKQGIRRLTPRECFTLQGFPLEYKLPELCDSALYKLAGNAVSLPVVELIAQRISHILD